MKKKLIYLTTLVLVVGLLVTSLSLAGCKSKKSTNKSGKPTAPALPKY
ncbi:MAG: hypothetical protein Q8L35_08945 [Actinomycetota bacterium]|nr:hypothetical protein [Actinomycetota bacterium]